MKDPFANPLANLRHLYQQMCQGAVKNPAAAAKGLLGPAIVQIEKIQEDLTTAETSRADENFVAAYLAWKADPTSRRRNHMIRRRRELIHASSTAARLAH